MAFKIVSEIQISGEFSKYRERISSKNKALTIITVTILTVSTALAIFTIFLDRK